jgi:iron complex outermembrane receptor protein
MNGLFSFNNIERIEVIKGPQGTLFGQSATGGLIHIITRDPQHDPQGQLKVSYGNYDTSTLSAYQTLGITDSLATDLSVFGTYQGEGFGRNLNIGGDVNYRREYAVRNKWLWTPGSDTRVVATVEYSANANDTGHVRAIKPGTRGVGNTPSRGSGYDTQGNLGDDVDASSYGGSVRVEHTFNGIQVISTSAFRHVQSSAIFDQDGTPFGGPPGVDAIFREETDTYQQEFLLNGTVAKLDWTLGAFYFKDESKITPVSFNPGPVGARGWRIDRYATQELESIAAFAQGTYHLTDATRLTAGVRYTMDHRSIEGRDDVVIATIDGPIQGRPVVPPGFPVVISPTGTLRQSKDFEEPTWRLALDHDLSDEVMVYASFSRGYKTGQYSVISYNSPAVNPEVLDAYEVGLKAELLARTLRINAAVFNYDYQDIQLLRVLAGGSAVVNAAKSRIRGADLDATWSATDNLQLSASVSLLDGEYRKYPDAEGFVPNPAGGNLRIPNYDASGNTTLNTPKWSATVTANYSVPVPIGALNFNLAYMHSDDVVYSVDQVDVQPAYGVLNASFGLRSQDERWGVTLFTRNLTDETYLASVSRSTLGDLVTLGPPRTYGMEFSYRW